MIALLFGSLPQPLPIGVPVTFAAGLAAIFTIRDGDIVPLRAIPRLLRDSAIISAVVLSITAAAGLFGRIILSLQVLAVISDFVDGPLTARGCSSSLSTCCF